MHQKGQQVRIFTTFSEANKKRYIQRKDLHKGHDQDTASKYPGSMILHMCITLFWLTLSPLLLLVRLKLLGKGTLT